MRNKLTLILTALIMGSLAAGAASAADAKPEVKAEPKLDAEGFVCDWLMLAPIKLPEENAGAELIGKEQVEKEAELSPKAGDKVKVGDTEFTWKAVHSDDPIFDFNTALGGLNEQVAGYLVVYLTSDKELTDVTLLVGSNDQERVYINGKEVCKSIDGRTLEKDSDKTEHLTLKKGVNTIVFKVINEPNSWQGCLRFTDKAGKPITGLAVKLAP